MVYLCTLVFCVVFIPELLHWFYTIWHCLSFLIMLVLYVIDAVLVSHIHVLNLVKPHKCSSYFNCCGRNNVFYCIIMSFKEEIKI